MTHTLSKTLVSAVTALAVLSALPLTAEAQQQQQQRQQGTPQQAPRSNIPAIPPAGPLPAPSVGVVDIQAVLREGSAARSVREQIDKQRTAYGAEISKKENDLRAAEQDLAKQRNVLSAEAFADKRRQLEQQVADFQRQVSARRRQLDEAIVENMKPIEAAMEEVLTQIAQERGLNMIMHKNAVILSHNALDLTGEVLQKVDRKVPRATVKMPPLRN